MPFLRAFGWEKQKRLLTRGYSFSLPLHFVFLGESDRVVGTLLLNALLQHDAFLNQDVAEYTCITVCKHHLFKISFLLIFVPCLLIFFFRSGSFKGYGTMGLAIRTRQRLGSDISIRL